MSVSLWGNGQTILQVVNFSTTTTFATTSTTFVSAGLSATITPFATTSKILILVSYSAFNSSLNSGSENTLYRNSTNLGNATYGMQISYSNVGSNNFAYGVGIQYLDSPATTSATTYGIYIRGDGGQSNSAMGYNAPGTITLLEISGA